MEDQDIAEFGLSFALNFATQNPNNAGLLKGNKLQEKGYLSSTATTDLTCDVHVRIIVIAATYLRRYRVLLEEDRGLFARISSCRRSRRF